MQYISDDSTRVLIFQAKVQLLCVICTYINYDMSNLMLYQYYVGYINMVTEYVNVVYVRYNIFVWISICPTDFCRHIQIYKWDVSASNSNWGVLNPFQLTCKEVDNMFCITNFRKHITYGHLIYCWIKNGMSLNENWFVWKLDPRSRTAYDDRIIKIYWHFCS